MEQFKICEKETKTKTYSKEGLARQEKLDPLQQEKKNTTSWISEIIERLNGLVEEREVEVERLGSGKGKKTNKHVIEEYTHHINNHKFHLNKLEGIMRLVNNDVLDVDTVNATKEDLEYYLEEHEDDDYQQGYDEEFFYETLNLEEIGVVNVDRVTNVDLKPSKKAKDDDNASESTKGSKDVKNNKKSALSSVIPMTIGRARKSGGSKGKDEKEEEPTPTKKSEPTPTTIPAARPAAPPQAGASMAAILKRETEQQEKERQKVSLVCSSLDCNTWKYAVDSLLLFSSLFYAGTAGRAVASTTSCTATAVATPAARSAVASATRGSSSAATTARSCCQAKGHATARSVEAATSSTRGSQAPTASCPATSTSTTASSIARQETSITESIQPRIDWRCCWLGFVDFWTRRIEPGRRKWWCARWKLLVCLE
jgi:CCR4-NOT transcriptional regulation complex NOT5 subunit